MTKEKTEPPFPDEVFEPLSVEEFVSQDLKKGDSIHHHNGVWWREVKSFFHMPAWFLTSVTPGSARPQLIRSFGGYYHLVPENRPSNGTIVMNVWEPVSEYSLSCVESQMRTNIRRAMKVLNVRKVERLEELLDDGYLVYDAWLRLKDSQGRRGQVDNHANRQSFENWIRKEFDLPKRMILGAYLDDRLIGFQAAYQVKDTATMPFLYTDPAYGNLNTSHALIYAFLKISRQSGAKLVVNGFKTNQKSLQDFKRRHGFVERVFPCHIRVNPILEPVVKLVMKEKYRRLMGIYSEDEGRQTGAAGGRR
jgi:hypothetical protein